MNVGNVILRRLQQAGMRVVFLLDDVTSRNRADIKAAANDLNMLVVDVPTGLTDDELQAFLEQHTPPESATSTDQAPVSDTLAADAGRVLGHIVNGSLTPLAPEQEPDLLLQALRAGVGFNYWCTTCSAPFGSEHGLAAHVRLNRGHITRNNHR